MFHRFSRPRPFCSGSVLRILCALTALALPHGARAAVNVDYVTQVKPLLAETCYRCHGADQQKGDLRLDTALLAVKGGETGPALIPGNSDKSLLIQVVMGTHDDIARMPYKKPPLSESQIQILRAWINQGAKAPVGEKPDEPGAAARRHWAFRPPHRSAAPEVGQKEWCRNAIDRFVLARLEKEKIKPAIEADRVTLIRRASLDLTGLPPTPAALERFVGDKTPDAYGRLVDSLLASPHFGERWGRHWLDTARYADSNGYSIDSPRSIWKYRDWVINALNRDLPFDRFAIEQIAGDMLPNATTDQKIATGFHRNTMINEEGGIDKEQFRIESIIDRVNTTSTTFLGLTLGCAQCHDHKFDPIAQKEYFQFYAFLNNAEEPTLELASAEEIARRDQIRSQIKEAENELKQYMASLAGDEAEWEHSLSPEQVAKLKPEITTVLETPPDKRTEKQKRMLLDVFRADDPDYKERKKTVTALEKKEPKFVTTMVMSERPQPRESYVFIKGDFTRKGEVVQPETLKVLHPFPVTTKPDRLQLARWIVETNNPLTARVTMNRVWQEYFGKGLVETENDFGSQGTPPSHPELLDWLATEFMGEGWSLKKMHRLIVMSATYRQSSNARKDLEMIDPVNRLLARQSRLRLDAEIVRDVALCASGLFSPKIGGPSVYPPLPAGVMTLGQTRREWKPSTGADHYRRGMYTFFWRATPHPGLMVFDAPDATSACTRRPRSNTPLQSLTLLNDQAYIEFAQALAARILKESGPREAERLEYGFRLCVGRKPLPEEKGVLEKILRLDGDLQAGKSPSLQFVKNAPDPDKNLQGWTTVARVLLNLDETITRE